MAIPLIQNVEKQDINTSIIAIKKELQTLQDKETAVDIDLSDYVKKDDVADVVEADNLNPVTSNAVAQALEDLSQYGTPLGTWASFENDYAPNIEWLQGGTTFNPNTYPALAMYLGGNTVPERYDHNRLGDYEAISLPTSSATAITMQYDGIVIYQPNQGGTNYIYINGVQICFDKASSSDDSAVTVPFRKGDVIYVTRQNGATSSKVAYYKHPLFIKATPTSADSDYEGTLNAIREFYVRNNTYSTEERLTGGVWIDGKPIYRRCWVRTTVGSGNDINSGVPNPYYTGYTGDIERVIDFRFSPVAGLMYYPYTIFYFNSNKQYILHNTLGSSQTYPIGTTYIMEYTKTSD